jgi:hypothetical protein
MAPPFPESAARLSADGAFDLTGYPTPYSDIVALMVFEHQTRMMNLMTRAGWESRVAALGRGDPAAAAQRVRNAVNDLVDYLLFVDEAPLTTRIEGIVGLRGTVFQRSVPAIRRGGRSATCGSRLA